LSRKEYIFYKLIIVEFEFVEEGVHFYKLIIVEFYKLIIVEYIFSPVLHSLVASSIIFYHRGNGFESH
jgi:hypothetical protein